MLSQHACRAPKAEKKKKQEEIALNVTTEFHRKSSLDLKGPNTNLLGIEFGHVLKVD